MNKEWLEAKIADTAERRDRALEGTFEWYFYDGMVAAYMITLQRLR
jgi:hypothetical protein